MSRVIKSVEVIHSHPEGPDNYVVGSTAVHGQKIADIIEQDGVCYFYNEQDELIMKVKNCPVVVTYMEVQEEILDENMPF